MSRKGVVTLQGRPRLCEGPGVAEKHIREQCVGIPPVTWDYNAKQTGSHPSLGRGQRHRIHHLSQMMPLAGEEPVMQLVAWGLWVIPSLCKPHRQWACHLSPVEARLLMGTRLSHG